MKIPISEFENLGICDNILRGVFSYGYSAPSDIQRRAIPSIAGGKHAVVQSKSGSGKTATFILGMLQRIDSAKEIQALVISPTRDLAHQTHAVFKGLSKYTAVKGVCAVGGNALAQDAQAVQSKENKVVFGTPGRILQLIREQRKHFGKIKIVVVDEADRIVEGGFGTQVHKIFEIVKDGAPQFVFASATLPRGVTKIFEAFLPSPAMFLVPEESLSVEEIAQHYVGTLKENKFETVCEVLSTFSISQCVIFANRKDTVAALEKKMKTHDFSVTAIHGDLQQSERTKGLEGFFKGRHRILISTDIASRGMDAPHVNLVINYDLPESAEDYLHRIGRGGRFGKASVAVSLVLPEEAERLPSILGPFGKKIVRLEI